MGNSRLKPKIRSEIVRRTSNGDSPRQIARALKVSERRVKSTVRETKLAAAGSSRAARMASRLKVVLGNAKAMSVTAACAATCFALAFIAVSYSNDISRRALPKPSRSIFAQPLDKADIGEAWIQPIRAEIHQDPDVFSQLGLRSQGWELWIYFRALLPPNSTTPVSHLRWQLFPPAGTSMARSWHDDHWDQAPNDLIGPTIEGQIPIANAIPLTPHDFKVHSVNVDNKPRDFRVVQYGAILSVPEGFVVGHDPEIGLAADLVGLNWDPRRTPSPVAWRTYQDLNLAGDSVTFDEERDSVELLGCPECFVLSTQPPSEFGSPGTALAKGSAQSEVTLLFSVQDYPWAWLLSDTVRNLLFGLISTLVASSWLFARRGFKLFNATN